MTNRAPIAANEDTNTGTKPVSSKPAQASKTFISEERRVQDALEDDEVREALRASHKTDKPAD